MCGSEPRHVIYNVHVLFVLNETFVEYSNLQFPNTVIIICNIMFLRCISYYVVTRGLLIHSFI